MTRLYNEIREFYEIKALFNGIMPDKLKKDVRRKMRSLPADPLAKPLTAEERVCVHEDGEGVTYYGICPEYADCSDEELEKIARDCEVHNTSPYDCSGKLCTSWITWKRTPSGVSFVHRMRLDV